MIAFASGLPKAHSWKAPLTNFLGSFHRCLVHLGERGFPLFLIIFWGLQIIPFTNLLQIRGIKTATAWRSQMSRDRRFFRGGIVRGQAACGCLQFTLLLSPLRELKSQLFKNSLTLLIAADPCSSEPVFFLRIADTSLKDEQTTSNALEFFLLMKRCPSRSQSLPLLILQKS